MRTIRFLETVVEVLETIPLMVLLLKVWQTDEIVQIVI